MKTESPYDQACRERQTALEDWRTADAKLNGLIRDSRPLETVYGERLKAAQRWTRANVKAMEAASPTKLVGKTTERGR